MVRGLFMDRIARKRSCNADCALVTTWNPLCAKQMKMSISIVVSLVVTGMSPITPLPAEATTIDCSELAKHFANGDVNFDESLKCSTGSSEMTYGRYCSRTQGIVCSKGRGWD